MELQEIQEKAAPIFRKHGVKKASVFGSVARGEDGPESDVDLLVELGKPMGLFGFYGMAQEIEDSLGKKVDLITERSLIERFKPYVLPDLKLIYEG